MTPHFMLATVCTEDKGWVGQWCPGIGDPTIVGWFTVVAYATCAVACYLNVRVLSRRVLAHSKVEKWVWLLLLCSFTFLCINKQLDLQSAMTEAFRQLAHAQGWYGERRAYQRMFIKALLVSSGVAAIAITRLTWSLPCSVKLAGLGFCFVLGYVLIRAVSFHDVDALIGMKLLTVRVNWLLELAGIFIATAGAWYRYRSLISVAKPTR
jgi:hypothetical protein